MKRSIYKGMVPIRSTCWLGGRSLSIMISKQIIIMRGRSRDAWLSMVCGKVVEFGPTTAGIIPRLADSAVGLRE